jgi:uncharacterized protein (UPF0147 family)
MGQQHPTIRAASAVDLADEIKDDDGRPVKARTFWIELRLQALDALA